MVYGKFSDMDFKSYLKNGAEEIEGEIEGILARFRKEVNKINPKLIPLLDAFIEACEGGKRIRGTLVKLGYEVGKIHLRGEKNALHLGGVEHKDILKVGTAIEILHAAILIHDDIIDESPTRRGQKSLYQKVGISQAITLADLGFFLAIKIISESKFEDRRKNQAIKLFSETVVDTAIGQMLDILHTDPETCAKLKTARYTIAGPLSLGAILAGAEEKLIRDFGEFGENLGIAFQIKDDILDGEVISVESAQEDALEYTTKAKKIIPRLTKDSKMSTLLEQMADYLVQRTN